MRPVLAVTRAYTRAQGFTSLFARAFGSRRVGRSLSLAVRGTLVLSLPVLILLASMVVTRSMFVDEERARRELHALTALRHDLEATASLVRRVASGLDLWTAAGLRGDLTPYHSARQRLAALTATVRERSEALPAGERDVLRQRVDALLRDTLARLQAARTPLAPLNRSDPLIAHDLRFAADALLAENTQAQHSRATALEDLQRRRVSTVLWGRGFALTASLFAIAWFLFAVARRLTLLQTNGSQLAAGLPLVTSVSGRDELGAIGRDLERSRDLLRRYEDELLKAADRRRYLETAIAAVAGRSARDGELAGGDGELRRPLAAIAASVESLRAAPLTPDQRVCLDTIGRGARLVGEFLAETVELARTDPGVTADDLCPENIGVQDAIREVLDRIRPASGISVVVRADPALGVYADRRQLAWVLRAMVSHAVNISSQEGHLGITATDRSDGTVRVAIDRAALGVGREDVGWTFAPFGQPGDAPEGIEVTALGLAMVKRLVELMGGAVGVEDEPAGRTLWAQFPRAERTATAVSASGAPPRAAAPQADRRSVLYIEDRAEMARLLRRMLHSRPDLRLITQATGAMGLESAAAERPVVILLDLNLSDMRAEDVLTRLKADPCLRDIPVVIVSGVADEPRRDRLLAAGAHGFVVKPFTAAHIGAVLPLPARTSRVDRPHDLPRA